MWASVCACTPTWASVCASCGCPPACIWVRTCVPTQACVHVGVRARVHACLKSKRMCVPWVRVCTPMQACMCVFVTAHVLPAHRYTHVPVDCALARALPARACLCVCAYTSMRACAFVRKCASMRTYACMLVCECVCVHLFYLHACASWYVCTPACSCVRAWVFVCARTLAGVCVCECMLVILCMRM